MTSRYFVIVSALSALAISAPAAAQQKVERLKLNYLSGRNQLGILSYCLEKGHIDDRAVTIQTKLIARMWKPTDLSGGDKAEAAGRKARITNLVDVDSDIETVSKAQNMSEKEYCQDLSNTVKEYGYLVQ